MPFSCKGRVELQGRKWGQPQLSLLARASQAVWGRRRESKKTPEVKQPPANYWPPSDWRKQGGEGFEGTPKFLLELAKGWCSLEVTYCPGQNLWAQHAGTGWDFWAVLCRARSWPLVILVCPFQIRVLHDSMIYDSPVQRNPKTSQTFKLRSADRYRSENLHLPLQWAETIFKKSSGSHPQWSL